LPLYTYHFADCPHARGGEPVTHAEVKAIYKIVPTHVGVNQSGACADCEWQSLSPRTWG